MAERKFITVYQSRRQQYAGVAIARKKIEGEPADAQPTFTIKADDFVPKAGDRFRAADGAWFKVAAVGEPERGSYPLTCEAEGGGK